MGDTGNIPKRWPESAYGRKINQQSTIAIRKKIQQSKITNRQ
jgi:hypothetical protein